MNECDYISNYRRYGSFSEINISANSYFSETLLSPIIAPCVLNEPIRIPLFIFAPADDLDGVTLEKSKKVRIWGLT